MEEDGRRREGWRREGGGERERERRGKGRGRGKKEKGKIERTDPAPGLEKL